MRWIIIVLLFGCAGQQVMTEKCYLPSHYPDNPGGWEEVQCNDITKEEFKDVIKIEKVPE